MFKHRPHFAVCTHDFSVGLFLLAHRLPLAHSPPACRRWRARSFLLLVLAHCCCSLIYINIWVINLLIFDDELFRNFSEHAWLKMYPRRRIYEIAKILVGRAICGLLAPRRGKNIVVDALAEWLRRCPAKAVGYPARVRISQASLLLFLLATYKILRLTTRLMFLAA